MNTRSLSFAAVLALSVSGAAMAQAPVESAAPYAITSSAVGNWIYDMQGNKIGSVRRLTDDGRTAVIMVGAYFQPGSYQATIPATALSIVNGAVTLRAGSADALSMVSR